MGTVTVCVKGQNEVTSKETEDSVASSLYNEEMPAPQSQNWVQEDNERNLSPLIHRTVALVTKRRQPPCISKDSSFQNVCEENRLSQGIVTAKENPSQNTGSWKTKNRNIHVLRKENKALRTEMETMKGQQEEVALKLEENKEEIKRLKVESDELKTRLSKMASDRLTDNNPNIADLSDENRAIKVGEKFSELYSNEWSDAFEELTENSNMTEREAIKVLLDIIINIFEECKRTAETSSHMLKEAILKFTGNDELDKLLSESLKVYKDERKRKFKSTIPRLDLVMKAVIPKQEQITQTMRYFETATEICWLMCIHDPPLILYVNHKEKKFNGNYFSPYTASGKRMEYVVWPALLLHEGGPLIQKGVAQGKKKKKKSIASTNRSQASNTNLKVTKKSAVEQTARLKLENDNEVNGSVGPKVHTSFPNVDGSERINLNNITTVSNQEDSVVEIET